MKLLDYTTLYVTSDGKSVSFGIAGKEIPVSYIAQEAPGTVVIDDTIRIPRKYDMEYILKRFNESAYHKPSANLGEGVGEVLNEREKTHGDFRDHAFYTRQLKSVIKESPNSDRMSDVQKEALDMILHKIGRILAGNPDYKDHWVDIEGYANLISRNL